MNRLECWGCVPDGAQIDFRWLTDIAVYDNKLRPMPCVAQGSLEETRYYLILAKDLDYGDAPQISERLEEVSKLLEAYRSKLLNSGS